jgi:hypothetical protein
MNTLLYRFFFSFLKEKKTIDDTYTLHTYIPI